MKPKLGRGIYYASIIITILVLIFILVFFTTKSGDYTPEEISVIRYIAAYFSFGVILALGVTFRELFALTYNKTRIIIKFIVIGVTLAGGVVGAIFIRSAKVGLVFMFIGIFVLSYAIIPTVRNMNIKE